jgi:hypothetical protein
VSDNDGQHVPTSLAPVDADVYTGKGPVGPRRRAARWISLAVAVIAVVLWIVSGVRDSSAVGDAARAQYRSITGEGGYDVARQARWGSCGAAEMTDGRTAVLLKVNGKWAVVRHSTYTDGYDLDSLDSAEECNDIATGPQAPSYP